MTNNKDKVMTPRQLARRQAILSTVRTQLQKQGYQALSMRKVAAIAGVSPSTLYDIYGNKESMILYAVGKSLINLTTEEEQYAPGLGRFLHRLDSIASLFQESPDACEALTRLLFQNSGDSPAKEFFLINAIDARKVSLREMLEEEELAKDTDLDFYARTLVSVTWGTVLFWFKGMLPIDDFRNQLIRSSVAVVLPIATRKATARILEILNGTPL